MSKYDEDDMFVCLFVCLLYFMKHSCMQFLLYFIMFFLCTIATGVIDSLLLNY